MKAEVARRFATRRRQGLDRENDPVVGSWTRHDRNNALPLSYRRMRAASGTRTRDLSMRKSK